MPDRPIRTVIHNQRLVTVTSGQTVRRVAELMAHHHIGAVPVMEDGHLVGIFTERDMVARIVALGRDPEATRVAEVMTAGPATITADHPINHALHIMYEGGFRHLPVVQRDHVIGMISMRDAMGREIEHFEQDCRTRTAIAEILA
jgi:CBS domain-containing protein